MAVLPQTRAELNAVIEEQVQFLLGPPQIASIGKLAEHFGKFDELAASFIQVKGELEILKSQLEGVLPQLESSSLASIADLESKVSTADAKLTASIDSLEKREKEVSDKLKSTFEQIDAQIESVQLQGATVTSIQEGVHGVVVKQQLDMQRMRVDVERYLTEVRQPSRPGQLTRVRAGSRSNRVVARAPA